MVLINSGAHCYAAHNPENLTLYPNPSIQFSVSGGCFRKSAWFQADVADGSQEPGEGFRAKEVVGLMGSGGSKSEGLGLMGFGFKV